MLALQTGLCPFIYFGQIQRVATAERQLTAGQRSSFTLWCQLDGTTCLERGRQRWQLRPDQAFLAEPGTAASWQGPAHQMRVVFDLVPRPRRWLATHRKWLPVSWSPQPDWQVIFGRHLEPCIDAPWRKAAISIAHQACGTWWYEPDAYLDAALRLGQWALAYAAASAGPGIAPGFPAKSTSVQGNLVQQTEQIIRDDPGSLTIAAIADRLGVSRQHLTRVFSQVRGYSPKQFMNDRRHLLARTLLGQGCAMVEAARQARCSVPTMRRILRQRRDRRRDSDRSDRDEATSEVRPDRS